MSTKRIYWAKRRRRPKTTHQLQRLRAYAMSRFVDESTVRDWIARDKIVGYKIKGRWWIDPESYMKVPLYDKVR